MANPAETLSYFARKIKTQQQRAQASLAKFQEALTKDAAHAFSWSDSAFSAAANLKVANTVEHYLKQAFEEGLKPDMVLANIRRTAFQYVTRGAQYPTLSASPATTQIAREEVRAWAEVLEQMDLSSI